MNAFWQYVGLFTASAIVAAFALIAAKHATSAFMRMHGHRVAFAVFAVGYAIFAGAKHQGIQVVEKPAWMTVSTTVDTNTWQVATFTITANGIIPAESPMYIDLALEGQQTTNWFQHVATTWATRPGDVSFATLSPSNPTNYIARIRCDATPSVVVISDFLARASLTNRIVDVTFIAPTNIVGRTGLVEYRIVSPGEPWRSLTTCVATLSNHVRVVGNFISRGRNREFRIRFDDDVINAVEVAP